jgi:hypothetical protein
MIKYYVCFFNKAGKRIITNPPQKKMAAAIKEGEEQLAYSRKMGDKQYYSYKVIKIGK